MRSRAELRAAVEHALRVASLALLAWMLWLSLDRGRAESVVSARSSGLDAAVGNWSASGSTPDRIVVQLDSAPEPRLRDWLAALAGAGSAVTWRGDVAATAISVNSVVAPRGGYNVLVAAPDDSRIVLSDEVGALDTATARAGGARFSIPSATGALSARGGGSVARAAIPDSVSVRRVLLLGNAGWESKFVTMALEEDGWVVDASLRVAPGVSVTQGATAPVDTARYAAVVAVDASAAARGAEIVRYVASGGGLLLSAAAMNSDAFASVRAGAAGRAQPAQGSEDVPASLQSLSVVPITSPRADAIALERRGGAAVVAARRHVAGRVLQVGYSDTWRWRMSGDDNSVNEHRAWWSKAVASTAFAGVGTREPSTDDEAPLARLVAALGAASGEAGPSLADSAAAVSLWWLFALLVLSLLVEWASRRMRGSR